MCGNGQNMSEKRGVGVVKIMGGGGCKNTFAPFCIPLGMRRLVETRSLSSPNMTLINRPYSLIDKDKGIRA